METIRKELRDRGIEACSAYELPAMGASVLEHIERAMRDADLIVAVVVAESSPNVFFELGLAQGLGKQLLLLVSPKFGQLPSDLAGRLYVRAEPDNCEAIGFALDQLLAASGRKPERRRKPAPSEHALGGEVDRYLDLLQKRGAELTGRELEELVVDVLKASGVSTVTRRGSSQELGADLAVWSDDLQTIVGNPLIVEVKSRIRNTAQLREALDQVETYRRNSNSQWALLILPLLSGVMASIPFAGPVLALTITDLLEKLRDKSFSETVRELRNARVHGGA